MSNKAKQIRIVQLAFAALLTASATHLVALYEDEKTDIEATVGEHIRGGNLRAAESALENYEQDFGNDPEFQGLKQHLVKEINKVRSAGAVPEPPHELLKDLKLRMAEGEDLRSLYPQIKELNSEDIVAVTIDEFNDFTLRYFDSLLRETMDYAERAKKDDPEIYVKENRFREISKMIRGLRPGLVVGVNLTNETLAKLKPIQETAKKLSSVAKKNDPDALEDALDVLHPEKFAKELQKMLNLEKEYSDGDDQNVYRGRSNRAQDWLNMYGSILTSEQRGPLNDMVLRQFSKYLARAVNENLKLKRPNKNVFAELIKDIDAMLAKRKDQSNDELMQTRQLAQQYFNASAQESNDILQATLDFNKLQKEYDDRPDPGPTKTVELAALRDRMKTFRDKAAADDKLKAFLTSQYMVRLKKWLLLTKEDVLIYLNQQIETLNQAVRGQAPGLAHQQVTKEKLSFLTKTAQEAVAMPEGIPRTKALQHAKGEIEKMMDKISAMREDEIDKVDDDLRAFLKAYYSARNALKPPRQPAPPTTTPPGRPTQSVRELQAKLKDLQQQYHNLEQRFAKLK